MSDRPTIGRIVQIRPTATRDFDRVGIVVEVCSPEYGSILGVAMQPRNDNERVRVVVVTDETDHGKHFDPVFGEWRWPPRA